MCAPSRPYLSEESDPAPASDLVRGALSSTGMQAVGSVETLAGEVTRETVPTLLTAVGLAKSFGATQALRDCSFSLHAGEVHAIVGENGSGKSTFVKIASGVLRPDAGTLELQGAATAGFASPRDALRNGIATVFQEVLTVGSRSVLDNLWLGTDGLLRPGVPRAERKARGAAVLGDLLGHPTDLGLPAEALSLLDRQACCIARALLREPRVLILDESTSALDVHTRDQLFAAARALAGQGAGIIFISHRMDEIDQVADRVTVMRSGATVADGLARERSTTDELVRLMTGAEHLVEAEARRPRRVRAALLLRARAASLTNASAPIDFDLHSGEIVGLAGLEGQGQDAFLKSMWGGSLAGGRVTAMRHGSEQSLASPTRAAALGVAYLPRERGAESLLHGMSIQENFGLPTLERDRAARLLRPARTARRFATYVEQLRIVAGDPRADISTLSGGNQQKVVTARWLATEPSVLLLNDPTRGIDLTTKRDFYALLDELVASGLAVVMLSSELDEHIELMDRVLVFRENELWREIPRARLSRAALIAAMFGQPEPTET